MEVFCSRSLRPVSTFTIFKMEESTGNSRNMAHSERTLSVLGFFPLCGRWEKISNHLAHPAWQYISKNAIISVRTHVKKYVCMWCLWTWFNFGLGSAGLPVGLDDFRGHFQPKRFYDLLGMGKEDRQNPSFCAPSGHTQSRLRNESNCTCIQQAQYEWKYSCQLQQTSLS